MREAARSERNGRSGEWRTRRGDNRSAGVTATDASSQTLHIPTDGSDRSSHLGTRTGHACLRVAIAWKTDAPADAVSGAPPPAFQITMP